MIAGCAGDIGDAIYLLGVLSELDGGPHTIIFHTCDQTKYRTWEDVERLNSIIAPLALQQPYISECRVAGHTEKPDWKSGDFRGRGMWCPKATLLQAKSHYLTMVHNIGHGISGRNKWLTVEPDTRTRGRIVVSRTGRYRNGYMPWDKIVEHYGDRLVFIGLPHEYFDVCGEFGGIDFIKTSNMLDVAKLIAGSEMVIANQSSINACAEGLKHRLIQETSLVCPDCIYRRGNAQHVSDGACHLPDIQDSGELYLGTRFKEKMTRKLHMAPPGGWRFHGRPRSMALCAMVEGIYVARKKAQSREEIQLEVVAENIRRCPDHFMDKSSRCQFDTFHEAYRNSPC